MIVSNLRSSFDELLSKADEIWFAVALIKETTYDYVQENLRKDCIQHYLVGIDLPTSSGVLRKMQSRLQNGLFESHICKVDTSFHPKLYLLRVSNKYTAFIGSSNLTDGGLEDNIELNFKISSQEECLAISKWFKNIYEGEDAYPLTDENLKEYEEQVSSIVEIQNQLKKKRKLVKLRHSKRAENNNPLVAMDFSDRYFKLEHHWAFRKELWKDPSVSANNERYLAQSRFLELHEQIYPEFNSYSIGSLEPNIKNHIVSMAYHLEGATGQELGAMWLSYGKTQPEINRYRQIFKSPKSLKIKNEEDDKMSFINHARLQIRIELGSIGIWILFGKNNGGSLFDRKYFFDQMLSNKYRIDFYNKTKSLPDEYWIKVNDVQREFKSFNNPDELYLFCKSDRSNKYFIIGRDYEISDSAMSEDNLPTETLAVFQKLFPIYNMMRHRFPA